MDINSNQSQNDDQYEPVDCGFHDQLLAWATLRQPVQIVYVDEHGEESEMTDTIDDVYTKDKSEFLRVKNGTDIRLDKLIRVTDSPK